MRLADVFEGQKKFIASILVFFSLISSTKITFATAFSTVTPRAKITESIDHRSEDELTQNSFEYMTDELTQNSTSFEYTSSFGETENYLIPQLPDYSNLNSKYQSYVNIINILEFLKLHL